MKRTYVIFAFGALLLLSSCSKKKDNDTTIITTISEAPVSKEVKTVGDMEETRSFNWSGANYKATILRKADKESDPVKDDDGNRYYENILSLKVIGPSGEVFNRTFKKSDFSSYIDTHYLKSSHSTLMGLSFSRISAPNALFVVTVGSPNQMDDEYMLVELAITRDGGMALHKIEESE